MPPLERNMIAHPTMIPSSPETNTKSVVSPPPAGGGAPPSALNQLEPEVGGAILTLFGLARVLQVRSHGMVKCQLKGGAGKTICILNESSYQVLSQAPTKDLTALQLGQYALRLQSLAVVESKQHHTGRALQLYERVLAVSAQLLQQRSLLPHDQRGDWVIRTVKCSIAAAQLAIQLRLHPAALDYTKDALGVLDALERKRTSPPPSPDRTTAKDGDEDTSINSGDSSTTSSTSTSSALQDLGRVKLFGECRIKALLLTAQALLELNQSKALALAALRLLEQAQKLLRRYSTKQYLEHPEFKTTMKVFVSLQKDLKRLKKQAKLTIKPKAPVEKKKDPDGFISTWFRSRRVMFADDKPQSSPSRQVVVASKAVSAVTSSACTWSRRDSIVLGSVVAGGLVAFHCMMRRHRL